MDLDETVYTINIVQNKESLILYNYNIGSINGLSFEYRINNIVILLPVLQESSFINEIKFSANKYKFSLYIMNNKVKKKIRRNRRYIDTIHPFR